jgi:hypothetical protein
MNLLSHRFYEYKFQCPLEEFEKDINGLEMEILVMLDSVMG